MSYYPLIIMARFLMSVKKRLLLLYLIAFIGSIDPDLIHLLDPILNSKLNLSIPWFQQKLFPWHWKTLSGSIYTAGFSWPSLFSHIAVLTISVLLIIQERNSRIVR